MISLSVVLAKFNLSGGRRVGRPQQNLYLTFPKVCRNLKKRDSTLREDVSKLIWQSRVFKRRYVIMCRSFTELN